MLNRLNSKSKWELSYNQLKDYIIKKGHKHVRIVWDHFSYYVQNESTDAHTHTMDNEVPDFARMLKKKGAGISLVFKDRKVGCINVGKEKAVILEKDFYSVLMGNLTTDNTNNDVQYETTQI